MDQKRWFRGRRRMASVFVPLALLTCGSCWFVMRPDDQVGVLARQLQHSEFKQRYDAAKQLEEMGANAAPAVGSLAAALSDPEQKVRYRAAKTLAKMGPAVEEAVSALSLALQDEDTDVRYYAAKAIYKADDEADAALPQILTVLEQGEPSPEVRRYLVKSLGEIGEDDDRARRLVKQFKNDASGRVREAAIKALEEMGESR